MKCSRLSQVIIAVVSVLIVGQAFLARPVAADSDWASLIWQNDLFFGKDGGGYTNGIFGSLYQLRQTPAALDAEAPLLVKPLLWALPDKPRTLIRANTIGQVMSTPKNIASSQPAAGDVPYAGLLFWRASLTTVGHGVADTISTTIGILGPASGAEQTQILVHGLVGATQPRGWEHQLGNEVVFQVSRNRVWRGWTGELGNTLEVDMLTFVDAAVGTLASNLGTGLLMRIGHGLDNSYASTALLGASNYVPANVGGGWNLYLGFGASYVFNQIFANGNTFEDSPSLPLDHSQMGMLVGFCRTWNNLSLTFAVEDAGAAATPYPSRQRFGSLVLSWRL